MSSSLKKLWSDYGIGAIVLGIVILYVLSMLYKYFASKGSFGSEKMTSTPNSAYTSSGVSPAAEGNNESFAQVSSGGSQCLSGSCGKQGLSNPAELLPNDTNSQWAQLNPAGKGDLANINLLRAGYHVGIDTVGSSKRNMNLQLRSEPPNPQVSTGIWNQSTITGDPFRVPFEIGQGTQ